MRSRALMRRVRQRLTAEFLQRVYRDRCGTAMPTAVLVGTARSGTTWLAELIDSQVPCRLLFEPFHPGKVPAYSGYRYFQYMPPDADDVQLQEFCSGLLEGRLSGPWIDGHLAHLRPRLRLVKDIRPTLMLKWLSLRFPAVPIIYAIRHPCAVVASRLRLGWATDEDLAEFLRQPLLVREHLEPFLKVIERARLPEEKHAAIWCISNIVPLRQFASGGWTLVFYEAVHHRPEQELSRLFGAFGATYGPDVHTAMRRPSRTTRTLGAARVATQARQGLQWERHLTTDQIRRVYDIVAAFGLDHLYGESPMPLLSRPEVLSS
jgi:hypothetical protein